ncbi:hypothetical protein ACIQVT_12945 [Streptomyces sp. NPDC100445]
MSQELSLGGTRSARSRIPGRPSLGHDEAIVRRTMRATWPAPA